MNVYKISFQNAIANSVNDVYSLLISL